jgi:transglutaminase-like putative cysteine protease/sugar lactone lactonase YvrE
MKKIVGLIIIFSFIPQVLFGTTGDILNQFAAPGARSTGMAYDGSYLWVADWKSDSLYQVDPVNGDIVHRIVSPGYFSTGLTWDGQYLWVADIHFTNTGTESYSGKIYQVCSETGKIMRMIEAPSADLRGLTWDGEYLWMSDKGTDMITQISPDDGTTINEFRAPSGNPQGLTWDGQFLWVADRSRDEIYRVHPESGIVVMIISSPGPFPRGLTWMQNTLCNTDYQTDQIYQIKIFDDDPFTRTNQRIATVEITHDIINFGPGTLNLLDTYFAIPQNRSSQEILNIAYSSDPSRTTTDKWNQPIAHFSTQFLKPGEKTVNIMTVQAKIYEIMYHIFPEKVGSLKDIPKKIYNKYLQDGSKYRIHDPFIQKSAKEAVGDEKNPYWIARNIFDYLRYKLHYERVGGWNIAPTVLRRGSGSCSEYTFVYIAMCRAAGVPARYVGSVVVRGDDASLDYVYHRWVEVYLPNYGWIPVDPSGGDRDWARDQTLYFGHLANRFLITTEGGGGSEYLDWQYNTCEKWTADGPVQLRVETIAEWEPLELND